jgi:competence protein ComEA
MSVLDKVSAFLDCLAGLPRWQTAVLVVLFLALLCGGYLILRPEPSPQGDFLPVEEAVPEEPCELTVYVTGAVLHPGVVRLAEGERVVDAIEEAGGPLPDADLESLNLAQTVQDGQKVMVPKQGQGGEGGTGAGTDAEGGKVSINSAGARELEELPGIGPTLAERIIAYREKMGGFKSVEELKQVSGIGEKKFAELEDLIEL